MYDFTYDGEIPVYWTIILAMGSFFGSILQLS